MAGYALSEAAPQKMGKEKQGTRAWGSQRDFPVLTYAVLTRVTGYMQRFILSDLLMRPNPCLMNPKSLSDTVLF